MLTNNIENIEYKLYLILLYFFQISGAPCGGSEFQSVMDVLTQNGRNTLNNVNSLNNANNLNNSSNVTNHKNILGDTGGSVWRPY